MERKKIKINLSESDLGQMAAAASALLSQPNGRHRFRTSVLAKWHTSILANWQTSVLAIWPPPLPHFCPSQLAATASALLSQPKLKLANLEKKNQS